MPHTMGTVTVESSLERLDRAISRIEQLGDTSTKAAARRALDYSKLDSRHDILRTRVAETIARLDTLIAERAPADGEAR